MASVVNEAVQWVGKIDYDFGSTDYFEGGKSDCSAFVQNVFKQCGISLPRTTGEQWGDSTVPEVKKEDLQAGDLVFFYGTWTSNYVDDVSHVGIYMGNDEYVHCGTGGVKISKLSEQNNYLGAKDYNGRNTVKGQAMLDSALKDGEEMKDSFDFGANMKEWILGGLSPVVTVVIAIGIAIAGVVFITLSVKNTL